MKPLRRPLGPVGTVAADRPAAVAGPEGGPMLFLHEVHQVRGTADDAFEAAYRDGWMSALAAGEAARLLWYCHHAHGTGPAYQVVTITAVADGAAWEELAGRVQHGDLRGWAADVDDLRHGVVAKVLLPVSWSPMQTVELAAVPTDGAEHEPSLYMEDTGWPHAPLDDYIAFWDRGYYQPMVARGSGLLDIQAVFQPALGAGRRKEAILLQKIVDQSALLHLLTHDTPPARKAPGQFMHEALSYRDRWESRLLRTASWSPLY